MHKGGSDYIQLLSPCKITDGSKIEKLHEKYSFELKDNIDGSTGAVNNNINPLAMLGRIE